MEVLDKKTDEEIMRSLIAEVAKANNELNCAQADIKKARSRLSFLIMLSNELINRQGD
jgi:hypothetical protein